LRLPCSDEDEIHAYEMREIAQMDWEYAEYHARKEGKKEGREEEKIEIAQNALAAGLSIDIVQKITGLDVQAIEKLK
jgi:predicted transposase/invertase (TIGR01784 family)